MILFQIGHNHASAGLVDAGEYAALKRRLTEVSDALEKISRGDAAYREGRTKTISSLPKLGR
jgi:hypothetical protein